MSPTTETQRKKNREKQARKRLNKARREAAATAASSADASQDVNISIAKSPHVPESQIITPKSSTTKKLGRLKGGASVKAKKRIDNLNTKSRPQRVTRSMATGATVSPIDKLEGNKKPAAQPSPKRKAKSAVRTRRNMRVMTRPTSLPPRYNTTPAICFRRTTFTSPWQSIKETASTLERRVAFMSLGRFTMRRMLKATEKIIAKK